MNPQETTPASHPMTTQESKFDDTYTKLKISNDSYFNATIEDVVIPLEIEYENVNSYPRNEYESSTKTMRASRLARKRVQARQSTLHNDINVTDILNDPCLVISIPTQKGHIHIDMPIEDIAKFIHFPNGIDEIPRIADSEKTIEVKLDGSECNIKDMGKYPIREMPLEWHPMDELGSYPQWHSDRYYQKAIDGENSFLKEQLESEQFILDKVFEGIPQDFRDAWAKANNCYQGTAIVDEVIPHSDTDASTVVVELPTVNKTMSFKIEPPTEWDEDGGVVQFVEKVGHGLLANAENQECYVSFEHLGDAYASFSRSRGAYLYAEDPTKKKSLYSTLRSKLTV